MHSARSWDELDKDVVRAFVLENTASFIEKPLYKVWRRRDIEKPHWDRLLEIAESEGPLGSSTVLAWQDHEGTWNQLTGLEPRVLAEIIHRAH